jgi:hypothetical protein
VTYGLRFVPVLFDAGEEMDAGSLRDASNLAAEGYQLLSTIQATEKSPAVLVFARPSGMILVDVEVPDDAKIQPVGIVPGNGQGPRRGFRP